ncbi:hypothetical protein Q4493_06475 [Colwellia sp. 1_MG-2023]|uniref:VOC family protein n=1 Tax=Colwellia sp. 1_MG-2023 TaxID=3062649 RepID=UPI0026E327DF|nr:hypothetical protein [Colwellia sp. 1_MG-2023]MDO6445422.1 hypothetical protein [Colwellia sp. 1_MG-2023]
MKVKFDHISLSAKNPEKMKDFLVSLLGLSVGNREGLPFDGYFLYLGKDDVIHIFGKQFNSIKHNQNSSENPIVDHVSFFSDNSIELMNRINQLGAPYKIISNASLGFKQYFVQAPEGLVIEVKVEH